MRRPILAALGALALLSPIAIPAWSAPAVPEPLTSAASEQQPLALEVERIAGANRHETAAQVSEKWAPGVDVAYVVHGQNFPDALVASAVAGRHNAPVLLTRQSGLPQATAAALGRLDAGRIVVIGGESAVANNVIDALRPHARTGSVQRVSGGDRYSTAAEAAATYPSGVSRVYLVSGENFPDALAAAAVAGGEGVPLLLSARGHLPGATRTQLERLNPGEVVVVGGPGAVSNSVAQQAAAHAEAPLRRLAGDDRYSTAAAVAADAEWATPDAYVASGADFPDALVGAALAAQRGTPLLLTPRSQVHPSTADALQSVDLDRLYVLGGEGVVTNQTLNALADAARGSRKMAPPGYVDGWGYPSWQDEFDGSSVDTAKWTVRDRSTHGNLSYDQGVISQDAVTVQNGQLRIRVTELDEPENSGGQMRYWQTGYMDTIGKAESQYGRWEFRAKLPTTAGNSRGLWPAFWLRNGDVGEIDILESWGDPPVRNRNANLRETSTLTVHESTNGGGASLGATYEHNAFPGQAPYDSASRYRTWAIEYTPDHLKGYIDGKLAVHIVPTGELVRGIQKDMSWVWGPTFANDPWHIRLCFQVGDPYWSPNITPSSLTVVPADFLVDYVRYWELP